LRDLPQDDYQKISEDLQVTSTRSCVGQVTVALPLAVGVARSCVGHVMYSLPLALGGASARGGPGAPGYLSFSGEWRPRPASYQTG